MKKKVAITFPQVPFVRGGAELMVDSLCENLQRRGYNAEIIRMPFKWYPTYHLWEQMIMWKTVDITETDGNRIDILIGTKWPSYFAQHPNKIIWLIHQHRMAYDLLNVSYSPFVSEPDSINLLQAFREADTKALLESNKVFTISKNVSERLKIFNNVDSEPLYHPPKHVGRYFCEEFGNYVLSVGRLDNLKRIDLLIESMQFTDQGINCVIAGTGKLSGDLQREIEKKHLGSRVKLIGFADDQELLRLYASCFAVYFAPIDEDYGYITLEAFLSGKPIITCIDSGGALEFATDEQNALISEPNAETIGENINRLYYNKALAKQMGANGFEKVKDITWNHALDRLLMEAEKHL